MSVLDQKAAQLPLPQRLQRLRTRIRRQLPRAVWLGRIGALLCLLLSIGMLVGIGFVFMSVLKGGASVAGLRIAVFVLSVQVLLGIAMMLTSLSLLLFIHRLYPYYYCQMLRGIHVSDFALLMTGEDIQREMDASWRERFMGMPLRSKLLSLEKHLESSATFFDAIYLYSRHQKWIAAMGRYRHPSRQVSVEVLYRWSWATILLLLLVICTLGVVLLHAAVIYCSLAPHHIITSARLAAFLDNYLGSESVDPAALPDLPREGGYFARVAAPIRVCLPKISY